MRSTYLLIHPPLLGPRVWRSCAQLLAAAGHPVAVPDLRAVVDPPQRWWERAAVVAAEAAGAVGAENVVVVGHSGAGVVLPLVADRLPTTAVMFVDAVVPARRGATHTSQSVRELLAALPLDDDGRLPPWTQWWPPSVLAEAVPDEDERAAIEAEQPRLPRSFYDEPVPVPDTWPDRRVGYLHLSAGYDGTARDAAGRGWLVDALPGLHLDLVRRPDAVTAALRQLVARLVADRPAT